MTGSSANSGSGSSSIRRSTRSPLPARPQPERSLPTTAARTLKRVTLELGGKSPSVVFDDADVDGCRRRRALRHLSIMRGSRCEARSRVLVQSAIYDAFRRVVCRKARRACASAIRKTRRRTSARSRSPEQFEKIRSYCEIGVAEGARVLLGGCAVTLADALCAAACSGARRPSKRARHASRRARRDLRPGRHVRSLRRPKPKRSRWPTITSMGCRRACGRRTSDARIASRARSARAPSQSTRRMRSFPGVPFGGYKQSGYGRELGMETMRLYSETKSVLTYIGEKPMDPFRV